MPSLSGSSLKSFQNLLPLSLPCVPTRNKERGYTIFAAVHYHPLTHKNILDHGIVWFTLGVSHTKMFSPVLLVDKTTLTSNEVTNRKGVRSPTKFLFGLSLVSFLTSLTSSCAWGSFSFLEASSSLTRASLFFVNICCACCQLLYERTRSWKLACGKQESPKQFTIWCEYITFGTWFYWQLKIKLIYDNSSPLTLAYERRRFSVCPLILLKMTAGNTSDCAVCTGYIHTN